MRRLLASPVLVAIFVVVDVLVIVGAWRLTTDRVETDTAQAPALPLEETSKAPSESPISAPLFLASSPAGAVIRVTRGSCARSERPAARVWLARSKDTELATVRVAGLREALGVLRTSDAAITITGLDQSCSTRSWRSADAGRSWRRSARVDPSMWHLPQNRLAQQLKRGPTDVRGMDCPPKSLNQTGTTPAAAVCTSQISAFVQAKGTAPIVWFQGGIGAATFTGANRGLAVVDEPTGCAALVALLPNSKTSRVSCIARDRAALGVATGGDRIYAQVGFSLLVSEDDGATFRSYDELLKEQTEQDAQ